MSEEASTSLYRHFDDDGTLLYVGISISWPARTKSHARQSRWFGSVAQVKIERFPSRQEALDAEREAIKNERPRFNIVHNKRKTSRRRGNDQESRWIYAESRAELLRRLAPVRRRMEKRLSFKLKMDVLAKERGWQGPLKHRISSGILDISDQADGMVQVLVCCETHSQNEWHWISRHQFEQVQGGGALGQLYSRRGEI